MSEERSTTITLLLFVLCLVFVFSQMNAEAVIAFFLMFIFIFVTLAREGAKAADKESAYNIHPITTPYNVYYGEELKFTNEMISGCLAKHLSFYNCLGADDKTKFLGRLNKFIKCKTFKIHDKQGFKEMPILLSASAIQLSFGMENYLLPNFEFIHIFPEEFIHGHNNFNFLEGNVCGQSINISWKHFLEGYEYPGDGQNVGLHEMAHAYYCQNFLCKSDTDDCFVSGFSKFSSLADKAYQREQEPGYDLYSDYALRNSQEFWAESIEIFFEKPVDLNKSYPDMYAALTTLLRQDPLGKV